MGNFRKLIADITNWSRTQNWSLADFSKTKRARAFILGYDTLFDKLSAPKLSCTILRLSTLTLSGSCNIREYWDPDATSCPCGTMAFIYRTGKLLSINLTYFNYSSAASASPGFMLGLDRARSCNNDSEWLIPGDNTYPIFPGDAIPRCATVGCGHHPPGSQLCIADAYIVNQASDKLLFKHQN